MRSQTIVAAVAWSACTALPWHKPLYAQDGQTAAFLAFDAGYLALTIASLARLLGNGAGGKVGDEVRVRGSSIRGRLEQIDDDSITIQTADGARRMPRSMPNVVLVHRGTERKWAQGWAIGLASGAALGAVAAHHDPPADCDWFCPTADQSSLLGGIAGGLGGSLVGALIGAGITGDHWKTVKRFEVAPRIAPAPSRHALGIGAHVVF